jgi:hypothetical protein
VTEGERAKSITETNNERKKAIASQRTGRKEFLPRNSLFYKAYKAYKACKTGEGWLLCETRDLLGRGRPFLYFCSLLDSVHTKRARKGG